MCGINLNFGFLRLYPLQQLKPSHVHETLLHMVSNLYRQIKNHFSSNIVANIIYG